MKPELVEQDGQAGFVIGVLGDSHVSHRLRELPPQTLERLRGCDLLLHAGDISHPRVLRTLESIAPVVAVGGNSDFFWPPLPLQRRLLIQGCSILLTHSHGGLLGYAFERLVYLTRGYTFEFHLQRVRRSCRQADIVVFGHTHQPHCAVWENQLLFNPGSLAPVYRPPGSGPKVGRLVLSPRRVQAEILDVCSGDVLAALEHNFQPGPPG
jgi:uncharacterized protein